MPIPNSVIPIGRYFLVTPAVDGVIGDFGGNRASAVGCVTFHLEPLETFDGSFAVVGRALGDAPDKGNAAYLPIPYRRISVGGAASDWQFDTAVISASPVAPPGRVNLLPALIQVPANGMVVGLLFSCNSGACRVFPWNVDGASSV